MNEFVEILTCPITQDKLDTPVMTAAGQTYSESPIENWLKNHDSDPSTNSALNDKRLIPNYFVANLLVNKKNQKFTDSDFQCPLTKQLIEDPVTTSAGYTYDRAALEQHIREKGDVDPVTNTPLTLMGDQKFITNFCAKSCIDIYKEEQKKVLEQKRQLLEALEKNDFETIRQIGNFRTLLDGESLESREKFLALALEHFQTDLVEEFYKQLIYHYDTGSKIFFATVKRIEEIAKANFYPHANPLKEFGFNPWNLKESLTILKEHLEIQRQFRSSLLNNLDAANHYSKEDILFSIDSVDENGDTLLHQAVKNSNLSLIEWLIDNSANCDRKNQQDETPWELAIKINNTAATRCLIENGVSFSLNQTNELPDNEAKIWVREIEKTSWLEVIIKFFEESIPWLYKMLDTTPIFRTVKEREQLKLSIKGNQEQFIEMQKQKSTNLHNALLAICTPMDLSSSQEQEINDPLVYSSLLQAELPSRQGGEPESKPLPQFNK